MVFQERGHCLRPESKQLFESFHKVEDGGEWGWIEAECMHAVFWRENEILILGA